MTVTLTITLTDEQLACLKSGGTVHGHDAAWWGIDLPGAQQSSKDETLAFPEDDAIRSQYPLATGLFDYFPNALAEVARISRHGSLKHNPGQPMHWARNKSTDHADKAMRHFVDRGKLDSEGMRHTAYCCWRLLALLQTELQDEGLCPPSRASKYD